VVPDAAPLGLKAAGFDFSPAISPPPCFLPFLRTNLISTSLPNACAPRINVPIVRFRGSFSIAEIFGALISAFAAKHNHATSAPMGCTCRSISETLPARFSHSKS